MLTMTLVMKMAKAVANCVPSSVAKTPAEEPIPRTTRDEMMMPRMPIPEIGLADVPMRPAM